MLTLVIVTYNRLEKLKKSLECYERQTVKPDVVIVVDNHCTDGTSEYLNGWLAEEATFKKEVIHSSENLGGAGGFCVGQKLAVEMGSDWVFVADDDAYAEEDMIEEFKKYVETNDCSRVAAICSSVYNMDGSICYFHRERYKIERGSYFVRMNSCEEDYEKKEFDIDILSYVGSFLNTDALKSVGLADSAFFIYSDDTEHSIRLKKWGRIVCVPSIKLVHEGQGGSKKNKPQVYWGDYYFHRNSLVMYRRLSFLLGLSYFRIYLMSLYVYRSEPKMKRKVLKDAFWDAYLGRMGKTDKYLPGWAYYEKED